MMTPTAALNRFSAGKRSIGDLFLEESRVDLHYGFRVGELKLLLKPLEKIEVINTLSACPVPNTPSWFAGMINLRGELLPVFDLNLLMTQKPEPAKWIAIFRHNGRAAGIYTSTLPISISVDGQAHVQPPIPEILEGCVENIFAQGDSIWFETDFEKLFMALRARF